MKIFLINNNLLIKGDIHWVKIKASFFILSFNKYSYNNNNITFYNKYINNP